MNNVIICEKCGTKTTALDAGFDPVVHGMSCPCGGKWIYDPVSAAASTLGRKGGQAKSDAKTRAARDNAKKGGWPKGRPRKPQCHDDGSVSYWSVYRQQYISHALGISDEELAAMSSDDRDRVRSHLGI